MTWNLSYIIKLKNVLDLLVMILDTTCYFLSFWSTCESFKKVTCTLDFSQDFNIRYQKIGCTNNSNTVIEMFLCIHVNQKLSKILSNNSSININYNNNSIKIMKTYLINFLNENVLRLDLKDNFRNIFFSYTNITIKNSEN